ncbi:hypothetical protein NDU88_002655 [Pleurodeles waltl]|uniref:Uncharacterized protein n=1 Tax=Pleurodeles waltl TaxID=8319 RepID=A0AAV7TLA8_PLEWA|nr:hypothetical protein NDU88_002655 [Pleurodeles waltl]
MMWITINGTHHEFDDPTDLEPLNSKDTDTSWPMDDPTLLAKRRAIGSSGHLDANDELLPGAAEVSNMTLGKKWKKTPLK